MSKRLARIVIVVALGLLGLLAGSCVHVSGGTWMVSSAPTPEGWPELTPVGEVQVKSYPSYREAVVRNVELQADVTGPMFMELFDHIREREIPMTAPVDMGYDRVDPDRARVATMAFVYASPELGPAGELGQVSVRDLPPRHFASVGVRGGYDFENFREGLRLVIAWLDGQTETWLPDGTPRYLGYNGPFTLPFLRYGEVQVPVRPAEAAEAEHVTEPR